MRRRRKFCARMASPVVGLLAEFLSAQPRHARTGVSGETSATTAHLRPALLGSSHASRAFAAASRRHRERQEVQDTRGSDWDFVWRSEDPGKIEIPGLVLVSRDCCSRCQCHRGSATSARAVSPRCRLSPQPCSAPARHADPTASIEVEESLVEGDNRSELIAAGTAPMEAARPQSALL